jgi:ribonuclease HI
LQAVSLGCRTALQHSLRCVEVRIDSELAVKQLLGMYAVKSPKLIHLHKEVLQLIAQFAECKLQHIPREANEAADKLANEALDALDARK